MSDDYSCDYCENAVEDLGLCLAHLNEELDFQLEHELDELEDPWPDFHDDLFGETGTEWR